MASGLQLIFIGTLHANLTPHSELQTVLEKYAPELLLVEIPQSEIDLNNLSDFPDEMVFAYQWAIENNIPVRGIDSKINSLNSNKTVVDNELVINEQKKLLGDYSWKEANKDEIMNLLDTPLSVDLVDSEKEALRESEMKDNIIKSVVPQKKVLVLTGVGHLKFFENIFEKAIFPYRK